jgi:hypothetical protein
MRIKLVAFNHSNVMNSYVNLAWISIKQALEMHVKLLEIKIPAVAPSDHLIHCICFEQAFPCRFPRTSSNKLYGLLYVSVAFTCVQAKYQQAKYGSAKYAKVASLIIKINAKPKQLCRCLSTTVFTVTLVTVLQSLSQYYSRCDSTTVVAS